MDNVENKCPIAKDGKIPLHWAARQGHTETIEMILQNITKEQASIQFYKCYICKLEVSKQTAFENHFVSEHGGKKPRGMTPYEYALYKNQWESAEIFRKYLKISEPAKTTKTKMMKIENQDDVKPEREVKNKTKNGIKEEMKFLKGLNVIDQLDTPMYDCETELEIKKEPLD
jgi:hypothetical protein